jgi:hypothetical protein
MAKADFTTHQVASKKDGSPLLELHIKETAAAFKRLGDVVSADKVVTATISAAGVDVVVAHQLGYVPKHVSLGAPSSNARVWQSAPATKEAITLRADAATSLTVLVA